MASTGAVNAALRAGSSAPAKVSATPMHSETSSAVTGTMTASADRARPSWRRSTTIPLASSMPRLIPTIEPIRPMTAACARITPRIEDGATPMARRSANSFCLWRTFMAKVFMMMKAPMHMARMTKTRMKA